MPTTDHDRVPGVDSRTAPDHVLGFDVHEVLIGSAGSGTDLVALRSSFERGGGHADDLVVLDGDEGLDEVRSHGAGAEPQRTIRHLMRHLDGLDGTGTGHVLAAADAALVAGGQVVVIRHVARADAPRVAAVLRAGGVAHSHYIGAWTTIENGGVPPAPPG